MDVNANACQSAQCGYPSGSLSFYAQWRGNCGLYYDQSLKLWIASGAAEVAAVLAHPSCRVRPTAEPVPAALLGSAAGSVFGDLVRMNDGEKQAALKTMVSSALAIPSAETVAATAPGGYCRVRRKRAGVTKLCTRPRRDDAAVINRFVADEEFINLAAAPILSTSHLASTPEEQRVFWRDVKSIPFNGRFSNKNRWLLPAFFQNLLPEGVFRDHVAELRQCSPTDHFELLAACGKDLPGNVYAMPVELSRDEMARYVTQNQDSLEMSVTAEPMEDGVSLSGVQPKVGVIKQGDRYVGRTKDHDTHIIAKLPVVGQPRLPELEHLSLQLAATSGVTVCETYLEPLAKLAVQHGYDLGDADTTTNFLAVIRYDRSPARRIHCEDFAQILGEMPEDKYGGLMRNSAPQTYLGIAAVLLSLDSIGEQGVHELLRRLAVNEMLGNPDMHLKNLGLRYPDGVTPEFPPAYDIVAYSAFQRNVRHALLILPPDMVPAPRRQPTATVSETRQHLSPNVLRAFCAALAIPEKPAAKAIADCVKAAYASWPTMIEASGITDQQKKRLLEHFYSHPLVASLSRREQARNGAAAVDKA